MKTNMSGRIIRLVMSPLARFLPPCEKIVRWESEAIDSPPSLWRSFLMKLHKLTCIFCRRYDEQLHLLRNLLRKASQPEPDENLLPSREPHLSPEARERIRTRLAHSDTK